MARTHSNKPSNKTDSTVAGTRTARNVRCQPPGRYALLPVDPTEEEVPAAPVTAQQVSVPPSLNTTVPPNTAAPSNADAPPNVATRSDAPTLTAPEGDATAEASGKSS